MTRRQTLLLLAATVIPTRSAGLQTGSHTVTRPLMGTRFTITCHHPDEILVQKATAAAFLEADKINACASDYLADSELLSLSKIPPGTPTTLSPLLFRLLQQAHHLAEKTHGRFDPTLGPLTRLWRESRRRNALPDPSTLAAARAATGWKNLLLDPGKSTATLALPGMRLDLGGIAKGQAADAMLAILKQHGIPSASITAGGDVRVGDPPPGTEGWKIGVRTFDKAQPAETLILQNRAVSTSGGLHQTIEIAGVRYAHLIDPATGLGLTRPVAATVIAADAATSDALATACAIADPDLAQQIARDSNATLHQGR